jgi:hypothetical protein
MYKTLLLLLGILVCPLSPAARACGDGHATPAVKPLPAAKKGEYIRKTVAVEIQGKLVFVRCLMFGRTSVGIVARGETYWLDLHRDKELVRLAGELAGKNVLVKGELEEVVENTKDKDGVAVAVRKGFLVNVTSLGVGAGESVKKTVKVEIQGVLREDLREILRPFGVTWYVTVDGKDYYLNFGGNNVLKALATSLAEGGIHLTGTLEVHGRWNIVHVTALAVR